MPEPTAITYIRLDQALSICNQWIIDRPVTPPGRQVAGAIRLQLKTLETITLPPAPAKVEREIQP